jgi:hypothetical protein
MPYPTEAAVERNRLTLRRSVDESGNLQTPWRIADFGQMLASTATLMERDAAYPLAIELARGKVNQVRTQAAEWTLGGLLIPPALDDNIKSATRAFSRTLMARDEPGADALAEDALALAWQAGHQLVQTYVQTVLAIRQERQTKLETLLSCRLEAGEPEVADTPQFLQSFNAVTIPFSWRAIEPSSGRYAWDEADRLLNWALSKGLTVIGGPLIDFGGRNLPDWLWDQATDLHTTSMLLAGFADQVVRRYHTRIRTWQVTGGSNCAGVLAQRDEELIWLTLRIANAVRRVHPGLDLIVGLAQPWGDYLAEQDRSKTPFIFADDLLRTGIKLAAIDLELVMGISPRGSYCRDILDASRLLDLYALLGVPIQATLAYPSNSALPANGDPNQKANLGYWRDGYSEAGQAEWGEAWASLALCKPFVRTVQWSHWTDALPHAFPSCGLLNEQGRAKQSLRPLTALRAAYLK